MSNNFFNLGDFFATIVVLGFILSPIILVIFIYKAYKRNEKRAEERLNIEKQQTYTLQQQVHSLNERLIIIEKMLKEVD